MEQSREFPDVPSEQNTYLFLGASFPVYYHLILTCACAIVREAVYPRCISLRDIMQKTLLYLHAKKQKAREERMFPLCSSQLYCEPLEIMTVTCNLR